MKKLKFLSIFFALCLLLPPVCAPWAHAVTEPAVSAPSALVLDLRSGSAVYSKNADAKVYPASTTKIMTVLLAVEAIEQGRAALSDPVTATQSAMEGLSELGSSAGIRVGEVLTLEQLMLCAMVSSANEACNIIAEHISGARQAFIDSMNARAEALGCTGTHFANAHGLPLLEHYTTAADFGRISLEAMRHPLFTRICGTAETEIPATNKSGARQLRNSNALLCGSGMYGSGYLYDGAAGVKTGHTSAAGYCLVSAASRGGVDLLALIFGETTSDACFKDTIALYNWAFGNYSYRQLLSSHECISTVPVLTDGEMDYVELCPAADFILLLPNDCDLSEFSREVTIYDLEDGGILNGPLDAGKALGKVQFLKNGEDYGSMDLVTSSASALVMDQKTGDVLFSQGADNRVYPADATALMTALLAVEAVEHGKAALRDLVTVTDAMNLDLDAESRRYGLQAGEVMSLEDLLYCALLTTGPDACNAIAEYVGGSVPEFVAQMNKRAAELGCRSTSFANTHGAYHPEHYTTARDFALIAREVSRHDQLMAICGTSVTELSATNLSPSTVLKNTNALLSDESYYGSGYLYEGATGMKLGYNSTAGYTLVSSAARGDIRLICLVFGGEQNEAGYSCYEDTLAIFDRVFDSYSYQEILRSTENIASVDVALGRDSDYVNLRPSSSISVLLPNDFDLSEFQKDIRVFALENGEPVTAPVSAGQILGEVTLTRNGRSYGTVKLEASSTVELSRVQYIKSQIRETTQKTGFRLIVAGLALLFIAYLVWVIVYRVRRLRHRQALRAAGKARAANAAAARAAAEADAAPDISFFRPDGRAEPPAPPAEAPEEAEEASQPSNITQLHRPQQAPAPAAPDENDLLREARCVATLAAPTPPQPEDPAAKAERDYFEEFFRKK